MQTIIHYTDCPVCGGQDIQPALTAKDHTVSGESFGIWACTGCTARFTQDIPDAGSIGKYYKSGDYISHSETSKGLINRLYLLVRKRTLGSKRKLVQRITGVTAGHLLDVGSGTGAFVHEMKAHGWQVTGLEPDTDAREAGKKLYGVELEDTSRLFRLVPGQYDAISLWHVLEHVHDLHGYMEQLKKLLKDTGRLFIAVPNYTTLDAAVYKEHWAAWDVPRHLYHFSPGSMRQLVDKHGMKLLHCQPMWFDSFYVSMLSSRYKNGKTNYPAAAWIGLRSNLRAIGHPTRCSSVIYIIGK